VNAATEAALTANTRKIQHGDQWYVLATLAHTEQQPQVLKSGETFAIFDRFGDIGALASADEGLYHDDTRHLSHFELLVDDLRPLQLGSGIEHANSVLAIDLMNPDVAVDGHVILPKGTLHLLRTKLLRQAVCQERLRIANHGSEAAEVRVSLAFAADFADLFEIRGMRRERRGEMLPPRVEDGGVMLSYRGLDAVVRRTHLRFDPPPQALSEHTAVFRLTLAPGAAHDVEARVFCECEGEPMPTAVSFTAALEKGRREWQQQHEEGCRIDTSNPLANIWIEQSLADLAMLTTQLPTGPYPFAGVPWYATTFGRDGILTAIECLWMDPSLARGVLRFLADTQATEVDPKRDAEPGKILHEARLGEMAATGEIPFSRYYGTVDATPLFIVLAALYWQRTGDTELIRALWPNLLAALRWMDTYGDPDRDGFVEYARKSKDGLTQQGWKDSHDSVFHSDGQLATAPIALCEVQGYVYDAKRLLAQVAHSLGDEVLASRLADEAAALKDKFQAEFWCEELGTYAIALDGDKRQCAVLSSNPGHCLWSGIAAPAHAARIIDGLMSPAFFTGWGIRTIAKGQPRYNPMSYHNGSVWPHDNAIAALGMARYGRTAEAVHLMSSTFDASVHFDLHRLPELFCGFERRNSVGPTLYPVACAPQAWAAAAPFAMLQACLGLEIVQGGNEVLMHSPRLPPFIDWLRISRAGAPGRSCDLLLQRHERSVGVEVIRKDPQLRVTVIA
jgi:glycogen debranching enzyme